MGAPLRRKWFKRREALWGKWRTWSERLDAPRVLSTNDFHPCRETKEAVTFANLPKLSSAAEIRSFVRLCVCLWQPGSCGRPHCVVVPREVLWEARMYQPRWQMTALMHRGFPVRSHLRMVLRGACDKRSTAEYVPPQKQRERVWHACHSLENRPLGATMRRRIQRQRRWTVRVDHVGWAGNHRGGP